MLTNRKKLCVALLITLYVSPIVSAQTPAPPTSRPSVVFFDDFSGPELDRTKWNVVVSGDVYNNESQAYVDSPETLSIVTGDAAQGAENGALMIKAIPKPGHTTAQSKKYDFVSARLNTEGKFDHAYGTWSARMKLPGKPGLWPAFWILGSGQWPTVGEIDVMENIGDAAWYSVALHGPGYSGNTPIAQRFTFPKDADATAWHIYSVDWAPDKLEFKVDGQLVYTVTQDMVTKHGRWAFEEKKYAILNLALGGDYPAAINKAITPYKGLPESTIEFIKEGKAITLVDWVRVEQR